MIRKIAVGFIAATITAAGLSFSAVAPAQASTRIGDPRPQIFVVGDSISSLLFFNNNNGSSMQAWWSILQNIGDGSVVTGVSAQGGSGLIKRGNASRDGTKCNGTTFGQRLGEIQATDYLLVEGGRNDYRRCSGSTSVALTDAEQRAGVQSYVNQLAAKADSLGIPRRHVAFLTPWGSNNADRRDVLQAAVRQSAQSQGMLYIPISNLDSGHSYDGTHPNRAGAVQIAQEVYNSLTNSADFGPRQGVDFDPTPAPPAGRVGDAYSYDLKYSPNVQLAPKPIFEIAAGALPPGLTLNNVTGRISGTPTQVGDFTPSLQVRYRIGYDRESVLIKINPGEIPTITGPSTQAGTVKTPLTYSPTTLTGGSGTIVEQISGTLPAGLSLNNRTGVISGTPTTAGSQQITLRARNGSGSAVPNLVVTFNIAPEAPPTISAGAGPAVGNVRKAYSYQPVVGRTPGSIVELTQGPLPGGLTLNNTTGEVSGTPTATGTFPITLRARGGGGFNSVSVTIKIDPELKPTIEGDAAKTGTVGQPLTYTPQVGPTPGSIVEISSGTLPSGLSLDHSTGVVSGTPSTAGTSKVTLRARGSGGSNTLDVTFTISP